MIHAGETQMPSLLNRTHSTTFHHKNKTKQYTQKFSRRNKKKRLGIVNTGKKPQFYRSKPTVSEEVGHSTQASKRVASRIDRGNNKPALSTTTEQINVNRERAIIVIVIINQHTTQ
jgi:hypothetical protein